jgi:ribonucleotide monophosphatase NagD (HAD superfamily)
MYFQDVQDDVLGALSAGLQGILVKTGKFRVGDELKLPDGVHIADDFPAAVDLLLKSKC